MYGDAVKMMVPMLTWVRDRLTSFFEESPGVMSSTRLVMIALTVNSMALTWTIREYVLRAGRPDSLVVAALASVITADLAGLGYVTGKRNSSE